MYKKALLSLACVSLLATSTPAFSGFGSSSSGRSSSSSSSFSSSRSSSFSAPSRSYSAPSAPSSFGGNKNLGMQRSDVTSRVQQQSAPSSLSNSTSSTVNRSQPTTTTVNNYHSSGSYPSNYDTHRYGVGSLAAAAAAGGLAGYALHSNSNGVPYTNPSYPGVYYNGDGQAMQNFNPGVTQPVYVSNGAGMMTFFIVLLVIVGIGGIIYVVSRRS